MAGSYHHLLPGQDEGPGWSMIENMGDAYECVEELFWLVEAMVGRENAEVALERFWAMKRGDLPKDAHMEFVDQQMSR